LLGEVRVWDAVSGECLEVIEGGIKEILAVAPGGNALRYRAVAGRGETVIEPAAGGAAVGWFAPALWTITAHPSGRLWVGVSQADLFPGMHLYIIELEGNTGRPKDAGGDRPKVQRSNPALYSDDQSRNRPTSPTGLLNPGQPVFSSSGTIPATAGHGTEGSPFMFSIVVGAGPPEQTPAVASGPTRPAGQTFQPSLVAGKASQSIPSVKSSSIEMIPGTPMPGEIARSAGAVPHASADSDRAAQLNLEYQKALTQWKALSFWKRLRTKRPRPPKGI
jgi:hypothetical protein